MTAMIVNVFDEDGEPVAMVNVQALRQSYVRGQKQLAPASSASTNDRGEFRIFGLPPGRYFLSATPSGGMSFVGGGGGGGAMMVFTSADGPGVAPQEDVTEHRGPLDLEHERRGAALVPDAVDGLAVLLRDHRNGREPGLALAVRVEELA